MDDETNGAASTDPTVVAAVKQPQEIRDTVAKTKEPAVQNDSQPETPNREGDAGTTTTSTTMATTAMDTEKEVDIVSSRKHADDTTTTATTSKPPAWDFSNRKVLVQGVMKFHDVKTVTKMLDKWIGEMNAAVVSPTNGDDPTTVSLPTAEAGVTPRTPTPTIISYDKVKKPPKGTWMVVTLGSEAMMAPFISYVNDSNIRTKRGDRLFAKPAVEDDDGNQRKRGRDNGGDRDGSKRPRGDDRPRPIARRPITEEEIKNKIIPLWNETPERQLVLKMRDMVKKCAMKIVQELKNKFRIMNKDKGRPKMDVYPWILAKRGIAMDPIVSAPTPLRNKVEFTFGYRYLFDDDDSTTSTVAAAAATAESTEQKGGETANSSSETTEQQMKDSALVSKATGDEEKAEDSSSTVEPRREPAIGFMVTGWSGGVSFSNALSNVPSECGTVVSIVDKFLSTSPLPPYDAKSHKGFWRVLTMRTSRRTGEVMIIIQHAPSTGGVGDDDESSNHFESEKARLLAVLRDAELPTTEGASPLKVTSIFFQEFDGLSAPSPEHPVQHAFGKTCLTEKLSKCTFQISPGAFFQVNTEGAELLYKIAVEKVKEVSEDPEKTLLFDVCCGTGTIGLTCLKEGVVGQVIGVDISQPAIEDAKKNAALNGFDSESKTRFVAARAEHVLGKEIYKAKSLDKIFVAVVDPAREGLHADVVRTIRANEQIKRLVYVSCNPTATLTRDAAMFCAPASKKYSGRPFKIVSSSPVDMFPLTNHCEMVMTFDRIEDSEMKAKSEK